MSWITPRCWASSSEWGTLDREQVQVERSGLVLGHFELLSF